MDPIATLQIAAKLPADPITASILKGLYEFHQFAFQIKCASEQTEDLLATTSHVARNIAEARRLYRNKAALLDDEERTWVDQVMKDTQDAMLEVAKLLEPARIDRSTKGNISFQHRTEWVLQDYGRAKDKHARLTIVYQSLTSVISCLSAKMPAATDSIDEGFRDLASTHDGRMHKFLQWNDRRMQRKSVINSNANPSLSLFARTSSSPHSTVSSLTDSTGSSEITANSPQSPWTPPSPDMGPNFQNPLGSWTPRSPDMKLKHDAVPSDPPRLCNSPSTKAVPHLDPLAQYTNSGFPQPSFSTEYTFPTQQSENYDYFSDWPDQPNVFNISTSPLTTPPINYATHPSRINAAPQTDHDAPCQHQSISAKYPVAFPRSRSTLVTQSPWAFSSDPTFPSASMISDYSESCGEHDLTKPEETSPNRVSVPHHSQYDNSGTESNNSIKKVAQEGNRLPPLISRAYSDSCRSTASTPDQYNHYAGKSAMGYGHHGRRGSLSSPVGRGRMSMLAFHASRTDLRRNFEDTNMQGTSYIQDRTN